MTVAEAVAIIKQENEQPYAPQKNRVARGFAILAKYGDDLDVAAEHDVIYAGQGDFAESIAAMSEADVRELAASGWHIDEDLETWYHFV